MNSASPETPDETTLREQLILAQVRLMETEDERDENAARLETLQALLRDAQATADRALLETQTHQQSADALRATNEHLLAQLGASVAAQDELAVRTLKQGRELARVQESLRARDGEVAALHEKLRVWESSRSWRWTAWLRALERWLGSP